jgi:hypothetical protein
MVPLLGLLDLNDKSMVILHIISNYLLTWILTPFNAQFLNTQPTFFSYSERLSFAPI